MSIPEGFSQLDREKIEEKKRLVFEVMNTVIESPSLSLQTLDKVANLITKEDHSAIKEERDIACLCAWLMCSQDVGLNKKRPPKTFIVGKGVVDRSHVLKYCSKTCMKKSVMFHTLLRDEPVWIRDRTLPNIDLSFLQEDD